MLTTSHPNVIYYLVHTYVPHYTKAYTGTFYDSTSQNGNLNVLLICLYQMIRLNIIIAEWLKYRAYELQITRSNPPWAFLHIY